MVSVTLDDRDRAVLEALRGGEADVASLAERTRCQPAYLRDRLPDLADNGLVRRVDGEEGAEPTDDDAYALTADGERAVAASGAGTEDDRIDTPAAVERRIESFGLRPDREAAVRAAFAFLRYWGAAAASEIVDGVYAEHPAGFASPLEWWTECVRDRLADLPDVDPPDGDGDRWRYDGTPTVERETDDGRVAPHTDVTGGSSVKYALERSDLTAEERAAVRAAFAVLLREGEASAAELGGRAYPGHEVGHDSPGAWWDGLVREAFDALPGVERTDANREVWTYRPGGEGRARSDAGGNV